MYHNHADLSKNRLYITLTGKVEVTELQAWSNDLLAEAKKLKGGFGVISDILECSPTSEEGRLIIQTTQQQAKSMGMGNVVRITKGANPITTNQWQRSSRAIGYTAQEAASVQEADKLLNMMEKLP